MGCFVSRPRTSYLEDAAYDPNPPAGTEDLGVYRIKSVIWSMLQDEPMYLQVSNYDKPDRWRNLVFAGSLECLPHDGMGSEPKSLFRVEHDRRRGGYRLRSETFEGKYVIGSEWHMKHGWKRQVSAVPMHAPTRNLDPHVKTLFYMEAVPDAAKDCFRLQAAGFPGCYLQGSDVDVSQLGRKRMCFVGPLEHNAAHVAGHQKSLWQLEGVEKSPQGAGHKFPMTTTAGNARKSNSFTVSFRGKNIPHIPCCNGATIWSDRDGKDHHRRHYKVRNLPRVLQAHTRLFQLPHRVDEAIVMRCSAGTPCTVYALFLPNRTGGLPEALESPMHGGWLSEPINFDWVGRTGSAHHDRFVKMLTKSLSATEDSVITIPAPRYECIMSLVVKRVEGFDPLPPAAGGGEEAGMDERAHDDNLAAAAMKMQRMVRGRQQRANLWERRHAVGDGSKKAGGDEDEARMDDRSNLPCTTCGMQVDSDDIFCRKCGAPALR